MCWLANGYLSLNTSAWLPYSQTWIHTAKCYTAPMMCMQKCTGYCYDLSMKICFTIPPHMAMDGFLVTS